MKVNIGKKRNRVTVTARDTFSLDHTLAKVIAPALRKFKKHDVAYPMDMTEETWSAAVDEMIYGFEFYAGDHWSDFDEDHHKRAREGVALFGARFYDLWW